jgi:hypothetical protein
MAQNDGGDQNLGRKGLRRGARLLHAQPKARTSIPTTTPRNEPRYTPAPIRQKFIDLYGREFAGNSPQMRQSRRDAIARMINQQDA